MSRTTPTTSTSSVSGAELDATPEHVGCGAKALLPDGMAQDDNRFRSIGRIESSSDGQDHTECGEVIR